MAAVQLMTINVPALYQVLSALIISGQRKARVCLSNSRKPDVPVVPS
jgi:hypothetical protein